MTKVVKCNSCNIVINEVLAFICNKIDVMDEDSISRICETAFSESDIVNAKNLLFESIPSSKKKTRKRKGKTVRDIEDIVCLLKETDPEIIPIFVARELQKLPPVLFDHLDATRILKDLVKLRLDVDRIAKDYATVDDINELKLEVLRNQQSTPKYTPSFEYGSPKDIFSLDNVKHISIKNTNQKSDFVNECHAKKGTAIFSTPTMNNDLPANDTGGGDTCAMTQPSSQLVLQAPASPPAPLSPLRLPSSLPVATVSLAEEINKPKQSFANITKQEGEWKANEITQDWKLIQRKRLRNRFTGNVGKAVVKSDFNFRAAVFKIPIYIYNVAKETTESDIINYIMNKANLKVTLTKWNMKQTKDYNAFKIFVLQENIETFLSDTFWPEGVSFRRFINFRQIKERSQNGELYKQL